MSAAPWCPVRRRPARGLGRWIALAALGPAVLGCLPPAAGPESARIEADRREMQHVFRLGSAQIASSEEDHRGAFEGYRSFLASCEADPASEVCSRNRSEAVLVLTRSLAKIDLPAVMWPVERAAALLERLHDDRWVPKERTVALEIHACAWREIDASLRPAGVAALAQAALEQWAESPEVPILYHRLALTWTTVAGTAGTSAADRAAALSRAAKMRAELARVVTGTRGGALRWAPAELTLSRQLLIESLERAAEEREARAQRLAAVLPWLDGVALEEGLLQAVAEWSAAAVHRGELLSFEEGSRAALARMRFAEARYQTIAVRAKRGRTPPPEEVASVRGEAEAACAGATPGIAGRACQIAVDLALLVLDDEQRLHAEHGRDRGLALRTSLMLDESNPERITVVKVPVPAPLQAVLTAMDAFVARATSPRDAERADEYRAQAADHYFFHGELAEAKKRLEGMRLEEKTKSPLACRAWSRLLTIAHLEQDIAANRRAATALFDDACTAASHLPRGKGCVFGSTAWELLRRADADTDPASRRSRYLEAAEAYERELLGAPERDDAVEAAFNGAYAYKLGGHIERGIRLYEVLASSYAGEARLEELEKQDTKRYQEHVTYLLSSLERSAAARVMTFDYEAAAAAYERIAGHARFAVADRRRAAVNAVLLRAALGETEAAASARTLALSWTATVPEKVKMDFAMATAGVDPGPPTAADNAAVRAERARIRGALEKLVKAYQRAPEAAEYVQRAAQRISLYSMSPAPRAKRLAAAGTPGVDPAPASAHAGKRLVPPVSGIAPMLPALAR